MPNIGSNVQFSRLLFRAVFITLAIVYILVMSEFVDTSYLQIDFNISSDVLIMTLLASVFVYFFMRKSKL